MKVMVLIFLSFFIDLYSECSEVKFFYTPIPGIFNKKPDTTCDVNEKISTIFKSYYGKDLIKSNTRIRNFLMWVQKDSDKIKKQVIEYDNISTDEILYACDILKKPTDKYEILGLWLGGLYIVSQYNIPPSSMPTFLIMDTKPGYIIDSNQVHLFCDEKRCEKKSLATLLIKGIDLGIHEFTHALPVIFKLDSHDCDSELATFYNQTTYALPMKIDSTKDVWGYAVRDIVHNYNVTKKNEDVSLYDIYSHEYSEFALGPLIRPYLNKELLLYSFGKYSEVRWGLPDYLYDLVSYEGKQKEYIKKIFESEVFKLPPQALDVLVKFSGEIESKIKQDDELVKYIKDRLVKLEGLPYRSLDETSTIPVNKEYEQRLSKIFFDTLICTYETAEAADIPEGYF